MPGRSPPKTLPGGGERGAVSLVEFAGEWLIPDLVFLVVCMDERSLKPCKG